MIYVCPICLCDFEKIKGSRNFGVCSLKCRLILGYKPNKNGCWIWPHTNGKYGTFSFIKKRYMAHKIAYEIFKGPLEKDKKVSHSCFVSSCINPDHLFLATQTEVTKNAIARGSFDTQINKFSSLFTKFTAAQVEEIVSLKKEGFSYARLSRIFNCSSSYINSLCPGKKRNLLSKRKNNGNSN